jgi:tetratricopeptide (TPR) repeat protein
MARSSPQRRARAELERNVGLAARLVKAGSHAEAIAPLEQAAKLAPDDGRILNNLGLAYLSAGRPADAVAVFRRALALLHDGRVHHHLGIALQESGNAEGAIRAYRNAVALMPELVSAYVRMADLLWDKGACGEAAMAYERAAALAPGATFAQFCRAMAAYARDRHDDAIRDLTDVVAREPEHARAHRVLGSCLQEAGRFDEARASLERSIALAPWDTSAYRALVCTKTLTEADRPWLGMILARLAAVDGPGPTPPPVIEPQRMMLHYAAGKAFDDLGDHGAAMSHFDAASEIRHRLCPFDGGAFEELVQRIIARFDRPWFHDHASLGVDDPTPILIVGLPRSGTTLLERVLSSHSAVRGGGELSFWTDRGPALALGEVDRIVQQADALRADYLRALRQHAAEALRATDKMPFNYLWIGLVHALFPGARFIHARRDPLDTCLSIHMTPMNITSTFPSLLSDLGGYFRSYARLMDHWRRVIPAERLLEVDYEDLVADPATHARRIVSFAGLPWEDACSRPEENRDAVKTPSYWQARQPVYRSSVGRWRRYEKWLGPLQELLSRDVPSASP